MAYDIDKIKAKAAELSEKLSQKNNTTNPDGKKVKVDFVIVVDNVDDEKPAIGYLRSLDKHTYMACMDTFQRSPSRAQEMYLEHCLIKEESDKRLYDDDPEGIEYWKGAMKYAGDILIGKKLVLKKK